MTRNSKIGIFLIGALLLVPIASVTARYLADREAAQQSAAPTPCYASRHEVGWATEENVVPCGNTLCTCDTDEDGINLFCSPMEVVPDTICAANATIQAQRHAKRVAADAEYNRTAPERATEWRAERRAAMREILRELDAMREAARRQP